MQNSEYVERIGRYISVLHRAGQKYINRRMQPFGFTSSDHMFLIHISQNEGINQRNLARILSIDEAAVTRAVKKLIDGGFVLRKKDLGDMRSFSLYLTERGRDAIPSLIRTFREWDEILSEGFSREELTSLRGQLQKMAENTAALTEEAR
ncbi:MarR family winged helix-turn-helix transcriptional regulator [Christensenella intestinihominis]|uniref:MarR family winged helix-turn-helix transcriptional regulator n=1 Tax=Christensenella intestinihominis TaxID=1851429 RepID=UPI000836DCC9|nr:MarR family transcriptional regulator [Christensenella intestinihominis]